MTIALLALAVLATGTARAVVSDDSGDRQAVPAVQAVQAVPAVSSRAATAPATPAQLAPTSSTPRPSPTPRTRAQVITDLRQFTVAERGLRFRRPVAVRLLPAGTFDRALVAAGRTRAPSDRVRRDPAYRARRATLVALGIARSRAEVDDYYAGAGRYRRSRAFYDARNNTLLVRGGVLSPAVQQAIVHELTHALQHQHFGRQSPNSLEATRALKALVEGDAIRVAQAWLLAQSPRIQRVAARENQLYGDAAGSPDALSIYDSYADLAGPALVARLLSRGGQPALDRAFRAPPTTTEQVLEPTLRAAGLVPVPERPPGSRVLETGVLGELGLAILLQEYPLSPKVAKTWRGDRYVTYTIGGRICTRVLVRTSSKAQQRALLRAAARVVDNVAPAGQAGVSLRRCDR